jgi:hypothetical protein
MASLWIVFRRSNLDDIITKNLVVKPTASGHRYHRRRQSQPMTKTTAATMAHFRYSMPRVTSVRFSLRGEPDMRHRSRDVGFHLSLVEISHRSSGVLRRVEPIAPSAAEFGIGAMSLL